MKKAIIIIIAVSLFTGCCRKAIPVSSEKRDSVRIVREVEYIERLRDSIIHIKVPVEVKEVTVIQDSSFLETSLAQSRAFIRPDGALHHTLSNKPQEIPVEVEIKDTKTRETETEVKIVYECVEIPVKLPLKVWQKFLLWSGVVAWIGIIVIAGFKVMNLVSKLTLK